MPHKRIWSNQKERLREQGKLKQQHEQQIENKKAHAAMEQAKTTKVNKNHEEQLQYEKDGEYE